MINRSKDQYQVTRRFGLRSILVVTALFTATLSIIKWTASPIEPFIFYFSLVVVVGGAQAVFERKPRLASILAGSPFVVIMKFSVVAFQLDLHTVDKGLFMGLLSEGKVIYSLLFGALYGYMTGTLLAGLYLVLDTIQHAARWRFRQDQMSAGVSQ